MFTDHQKKEPPNCTIPEVSEATLCIVLTGGVILAKGGRGGRGVLFIVTERQDLVLPG